MQKLAALEGDGYFTLSQVVVTDTSEVTLRTTYIDANVTVPVSDEDTVFADKYQGTGKNAGVSFAGYTGDVTIDLNNYDSSTQLSLMEAGVNVYESVTAVRASDGNSVIVGSSSAETIYAGMGAATIGGGGGRDLINGYTDTGKYGAATYVFEEGNGKDTITGFEAYTGTNTTADVLALGESLAAGDDPEVKITNGNVRLSFSSSDQITLVDMENKKFYFGDTEVAIVAEVGNNLEYDANVLYYMGEDDATITVGDIDQTVNTWMNLSGIEGLEEWGKYDNIRVLDASSLYENATLVGGFETDNVIYGGHAVNSLWGGNGGNDTLYGGGTANEYYYLTDGGNDVIENAKDGDVVNLLGIDLNNYDINSLVDGVSTDAVEIKFNDGGSVKVNNDANVTFKIIDGHKWTVNRETKEWSYQGQD